ncbi:DUF1566 domain-containing protein [Sulfurimonas sp. HSL-1656]|uniref:Lcl domain-containing protein n=1 Tax=Thiomicrolovo subterrani TaxID=3131934 RepID=UPI0031F9FAB0
MRLLILPLLAATMTIWFAGCGSGDSTESTSPDGAPLNVLSMSPDGNATGIVPDTNISVTFSALISAATINATSFEIQDESNSSVVGNIVVNGAKAIFDPVGDLSFGTKYTGILTTQVTDVQGNPLAHTFRWSFTTIIAPVLFKTGQTKSYDENGIEVIDSSLKDDGYYQKGDDHNYSRDNANEIVTDHSSGLMWQDDANVTSVSKPWLTSSNALLCSDSGDATSSSCLDTSGDTAATYCENLTLGGFTDWRLPTLKELEGLSDFGIYNPALGPVFQHVVSTESFSIYWSSTSYVYFPNFALGINFYHGGSTNNYKDADGFIRCVRVKQ